MFFLTFISDLDSTGDDSTVCVADLSNGRLDSISNSYLYIYILLPM